MVLKSVIIGLVCLSGCATVGGGYSTGGQMPYAQDCAVRLRPPSPDKIPVMNGSVSTDGKIVRLNPAEVPQNGIMQRDTHHCEKPGPNSTRITVNTPGFDIVLVKKLPDTTPAAVSDGLADYSIDSLPRGQWKQLKDRWQDADR